MKNAYKIKPEIKEFIIQKAKVEPEVGCRKLSLLAQEQFQISVSKSTISTILKNAGLNKAVGRRRLLPLPLPQPACEPCVDILSLKFLLEDKSYFFLDASSYSLWPTQRIPKDFSQPMLKVKEHLIRPVFLEGQPLVLLAPPGFYSPAPAILNFITCFQAEEPVKAIKNIELYTKAGKLYETLCPVAIQRRYFIFGWWPWQYKNQTGCFSSLRQAALKINGRDTLTLITNIEENLLDNPNILQRYLKRWPNPETDYQYFLNKIRDTLRSPTHHPHPSHSSIAVF